MKTFALFAVTLLIAFSQMAFADDEKKAERNRAKYKAGVAKMMARARPNSVQAQRNFSARPQAVRPAGNLGNRRANFGSNRSGERRLRPRTSENPSVAFSDRRQGRVFTPSAPTVDAQPTVSHPQVQGDLNSSNERAGGRERGNRNRGDRTGGDWQNRGNGDNGAWRNRDRDGDGIPNWQERNDGDGNNADRRNRDRDGDGIPNWQERNDGDGNNADRRNRDRDGDGIPNWRERNDGDGDRNRNWNRGNHRNHRRHDWNRSHRNRDWWRSNYSRFALFGGGYYYFNSGYWYPAYGYDPYRSTYTYDAPIYAYGDQDPGQVIASVQETLQERGYYVGAIDGSFGPMTRQALIGFQQDNNLPVTGEIDQDTLSALGFE